MYQLRKNVLRMRHATAVAVVFGSVAWLGLLIGEAAPSPAAWHIAGASSAARHHLQAQFDNFKLTAREQEGMNQPCLLRRNVSGC
jgi:hypothetical protein